VIPGLVTHAPAQRRNYHASARSPAVSVELLPIFENIIDLERGRVESAASYHLIAEAMKLSTRVFRDRLDIAVGFSWIIGEIAGSKTMECREKNLCERSREIDNRAKRLRPLGPH